MSAPHPIVIEATHRREELGLTRDDVHAITGLARSTVRNWETGRRAPMLGAFDAYLRANGLKLAVVALEQPVDVVVGDQLPFGELVLDASEKFCGGCQQARHRSNFHSDRTRGDGLSPRCKWCVSEKRQRQRRDRTDREQREVA